MKAADVGPDGLADIGAATSCGDAAAVGVLFWAGGGAFGVAGGTPTFGSAGTLG